MILGDTYDATPLVPLVHSLPSDSDSDSTCSSLIDLLIHESTNAFLPHHDPSQHFTRPNPPTLESVTNLAKEHGHSTPQVAGSFAKLVRAERLCLNHLSVKYPDPGDEEESKEEEEGSSKGVWRGMLREIERQAEESWIGKQDEQEGREEGKEKREEGEWKVKTARDFMEIEIPRRDKVGKEGKGGGGKGKGK